MSILDQLAVVLLRRRRRLHRPTQDRIRLTQAGSGGATAGDATTSGAGVREITGSGGATASASSTSGAGAHTTANDPGLKLDQAPVVLLRRRGRWFVLQDQSRIIVISAGSGGAVSGDSSTSGTGAREITGSGGAVSGDSQTSGAATKSVTGSGGAVSGDSATSGEGQGGAVIKRLGQGVIALLRRRRKLQRPAIEDPPQVSTTKTGSGGAQSGDATTSGEGSVVRPGQVQPNLEVPKLIRRRGRNVVVVENLYFIESVKTGSGGAQAGDSSTSGVGKRTITGSGSALAGTSSTEGAGEREITGSGGATSGDAATSGSGVAGQIVGSGGAVSGDASTSGSGDREVAGSGGAVSGDATTDGEGALEGDVSGSGGAQAGDATTSGTGLRLITGSGGAASGNSSTSGVALRVITGSGGAQAGDAATSGSDTPGGDGTKVSLTGRFDQTKSLTGRHDNDLPLTGTWRD